MATRHLGELGTSHDDDDDITFSWFGHTIRVGSSVDDLEVLEFMEQAKDVTDLKGAQAIGVVMGFLRGLVHPDDWDLFWSTAKANHQSSLDLMRLAKSIMEAKSGFPTGPLSALQGGQWSMPQRSAVESSSDRALRLLRGRPDLQQAVFRAQEAADAG